MTKDAPSPPLNITPQLPGPAESAYMRIAIKPTIDAIVAGRPPPPSAEAEVQIRDAAAGVAKLAPVLAQQLFAADPASLKYLKASYADNGNSQNRANATFLDTTRV